MKTPTTNEILRGAGFDLHPDGLYTLDIKAESPMLELMGYPEEDPDEFAVIISIRYVSRRLVMDMAVISTVTYADFCREVIYPTSVEEICDFLKKHGLPKDASRFDVFIKQ